MAELLAQEEARAAELSKVQASGAGHTVDWWSENQRDRRLAQAWTPFADVSIGGHSDARSAGSPHLGARPLVVQPEVYEWGAQRRLRPAFPVQQVAPVAVARTWQRERRESLGRKEAHPPDAQPGRDISEVVLGHISLPARRVLCGRSAKWRRVGGRYTRADRVVIRRVRTHGHQPTQAWCAPIRLVSVTPYTGPPPYNLGAAPRVAGDWASQSSTDRAFTLAMSISRACCGRPSPQPARFIRSVESACSAKLIIGMAGRWPSSSPPVSPAWGFARSAQNPMTRLGGAPEDGRMDWHR